ncbi:hypothetical protein ACFTAO_00690 [Paenibacillus rhizoplanae]
MLVAASILLIIISSLIPSDQSTWLGGVTDPYAGSRIARLLYGFFWRFAKGGKGGKGKD